jgi:hypothetical protein
MKSMMMTMMIVVIMAEVPAGMKRMMKTGMIIQAAAGTQDVQEEDLAA